MVNIKEGARRLRVVGQVLTAIGIVMLALFLVAWQLPSWQLALLQPWSLHIILLVAGIAAWAAGWILEGFAQ
jgi:hypothetical protein